ncbi:MAG: acyl-CoA reductase [Rikenellaceae bacterium]
MKNIVEIAVSLSERLSLFGQTEQSQAVVERALTANSWFCESDILMAINAIRTQMLDPVKLKNWIEAYPTLCEQTPRRIAIIMAGNIPLVGFFDLLCSLAAGHQSWIKPSSKDRALMEYIVGELLSIEPDIPIYIYDDDLTYDAVIATGGNEANRYFEARFGSCKRLCRSSRRSIAVITEETSSEEMRKLSNDIYSYSALGCRNVATIFAPRGVDILITARETHSKYRNNYIQTKAMLSLQGLCFEDNGSSVIRRTRELPNTLSTITIWEYDSLEQVREWIDNNDHLLQCIVSCVVEHPRRVGFGETQHPTLFDYADGVDTMKFLDFNS